MNNRLKWVDALRGYGAIAVMICHLTQFLVYKSMIATNAIFNFTLNGARAVQLFFMLAGMMSFYSLAGNKKTYKSYIINKILTLFPLYCFFIIVCLIVGKGYSLVNFNDVPQKISVGGIILNVLFLHEFSPRYINTVVPGGWFLATIWIYYLIAPLLFKLIKTLSRSVKFAFGALCIRILTHSLTHSLL